MIEHTAEPDLRSIFNPVDGEFIGMSRGKCVRCGRTVDFDDDNCWHVEDE